jgi:hypothetical protein
VLVEVVVERVSAEAQEALLLVVVPVVRVT